jgi:hypothetical protein
LRHCLKFLRSDRRKLPAGQTDGRRCLPAALVQESAFLVPERSHRDRRLSTSGRPVKIRRPGSPPAGTAPIRRAASAFAVPAPGRERRLGAAETYSEDIDSGRELSRVLPGRNRGVPPLHRLAHDWAHSALHLGSAAIAAYAGWLAGSATPATLFAWAVAIGYGILGVVGWFIDGLLLATPVAIPLGPVDNVFHLALGGAALVVVASGRIRRRAPHAEPE